MYMINKTFFIIKILESNNRRRRRGVQLPRRLIKNTKFNNLWGFPRVKEKKIG